MGEGKRIVQAQEREIGREVVHFAPGEGSRSLWAFGELVIYKTRSEQTGGAYSLFEVVAQPGVGSPSHVQHREDESFYVLEGGYEFQVEGRILRLVTGALLYVPKGTLHAHRNVGEGVGRMLMSQTPGGLHERFFEEIGKKRRDEFAPPVYECQQDVETIARIAAEYGIEMPLPGRLYDE